MARDHINIRAGFDLASFSTSAQNLERELRATGQRMTRIGRNMSLALSLPTLGAGIFATKQFAEFEQAMAKVNAVSGATSNEFDMLTSKAEELGRTTAYTASEVAGLELSYAKLGFSANEIEKITEATLNLALATDEDLGNAAMVAGNTLRGFALDASEMGRVVDVMAKSFTSSALDLEKYSVSITKVASIANTLGFSIERVAAMQSTLVDTGIEASIVGTSLRKIFVTLAAKGITYEQAMAKIANSQEKVNTAVGLFDVRAANAAVVLSQATEKVDRLTVSYRDSSGAAAEMAKIMNNTLQMSFIRLKSAVEGLAIKFGEQLAPALRSVADMMSEWARKFAELEPTTKKMIIATGALVVAIPPLIIVIGQMQIAMVSLNLSMWPVVAAAGAFLAILRLSMAAVELNNRYLKKQTEYYDKSKEYLDTLNTSLEDNKTLTEELNKVKEIGFNTSEKELTALESDILMRSEANKGLMKELRLRKEVLLQKEKDYLQSLKNPAIGAAGDVVQAQLKRILPIQQEIKILEKDFAALQAREDEYITGLTELWRKLAEIRGFNKTSGVDGLGDDIGDKLKEEIKKMESLAKEFRDKQQDIFNSITRTTGDINPFVNALLGDKTAVTRMIDERLSEYKVKIIEGAGDIAQGLQNLLIKSKNNITEFTQTLNDEVLRGVQDMAYGLAEMFGTMLTDDSFTSKDFGKGVLDMVATFMQRLGGLLIIWGINFELFQKSIKSGQGWLAVVAGAAMVATGAAIKGAMNSGLESSSTSSSTPSYSSNGANYGAYSPDYVITLQGREMIIVQKRESSFRR